MPTREQSNRPKTIKAYLREAGIQPSGSIRSAISRGIDDALFALWENTCALEGPEEAAILLFALVSFDPAFRLPLWLVQRFKAHRAPIIDAVTSGHIERIQYALSTW